MTLNCCKVKFSWNSRHFSCFGGNNSQTNEDSYCQQWNCSPLNVLFSDVQIVLISQGVPPLGGVKQRWGGKKHVFIHTRLSRAYLELARLSCEFGVFWINNKMKPSGIKKIGLHQEWIGKWRRNKCKSQNLDLLRVNWLKFGVMRLRPE